MQKFSPIAVFLMISFFAIGAAVPSKLWAGEDPLRAFDSENGQEPGDPGQDSNRLPEDANQPPAVIAKTVTAPVKPLQGKEKFKFYLRTTYGPGSLINIAAAAGIKQARNSPPEWGQGMEGFGSRFASGFGLKAIKLSIQSGIEGLLGEDPRYYASARSGVFHRAFYAAGQTFVSHKDAGGTGFAYARFIGIAGGVCISRQWHPENDRSARDYFVAGAAIVGIDMARFVFREFWPDIKRTLRGK
jgi:hypothetical protein